MSVIKDQIDLEAHAGHEDEYAVDCPLCEREQALADSHERGFEAGYSAAIHDAKVEGSRAHAALEEDTFAARPFSPHTRY